MASANQLQLIFFPLMAQGHMIPLFDIARLCAARGVKATLVTTPANAGAFPQTDAVEIKILRFPSTEVGLPEGVENVTQLTEIDHSTRFAEALKLIVDGQLAELLEEERPSCLVGDMFIPWAANTAAKLNIPWVAFNVGGYLAAALTEVVRREDPQWGVESEDEEFVVPVGEHRVMRLTRKKLSSAWTEKEPKKSALTRQVEAAFEAAAGRSFGVIMNSFYELESDYADHYQKATGKRCWGLAPASLCFRNMEDKARRGKQANIDVHECLNWLDSKPENSVIYVCFGSITHMSSAQLTEIALALEASGHHFIWAVRGPNRDEDWLPSGFETRTKSRGLIIRGWAPQVMILDHKATGGFVTHCGWNSTLEGVSAGVPMVTWPMFAEQFMNEKLITEVLKVGVSVGADHNYDWLVEEARMGRVEIEAAVRRVMDGAEAEEMRRKATELKELAWEAVQQEGSSYNALTCMLDALSSYHHAI